MNKKASASLLFLGTGSSMGVPVIGCHCQICKSKSHYNKRLRPSALITVENKRYVIDTSPDFRYQALRYQVENLNGVIYTHAHHDHTAGIDELRVFYKKNKQNVPCLLSNETAEDLKRRFAYIFRKKRNSLVAQLELNILEKERGTTFFDSLKIDYMTYKQLGMSVNGYCFGNLAYVSDIKDYPISIFEDLKGVEILILSALRHDESHIHFSIKEACSFAQKIGAKMTWLTHVSHETDHESTNRDLPDNVQLAYDGLSVDFEAEIIT